MPLLAVSSLLALPRACLPVLQAARSASGAESAAEHAAHVSQFLPHGYCYLWEPRLLWTHFVSDLAIGLSYIAISITLAWLVHRARREIPFSTVFVAFGLFIIACGFTHLMEVWTLWEPHYWLAGGIKVVTALASVSTAIALPFTVPRVFDTIRDARLSRERQILAERAAAERASHALLRGVFEGTPDPVFVKDDAGRYLMLNSATARAIGRSVDEMLGRTDAELLPPDVAARVLAADARVRASGETVTTEERVGPPGGPQRTFLTSKGPYRDATGAIVGIFGVARDVTERTEAAEELARANRVLEDARARAEAASRAKSEFLATMSHELRTPLNAILGYADLLAMGLPGALSEGQRDYLARIEGSGRHLLSLIDDVLDVAKVEAGTLTVELRPSPVDATLDAALDLVRPLADAKGVALARAATCPPGTSYVGDPDRVRQVLLNLLTNAVKFTDAGGRVELRCAHAPGDGDDAGSWVVLEVADTGIGIPADKLEAIFEPFVQVEQGLNRRAGGTGLGLAIARRLVRLMGGQLTAASRVGAGSTFTVRLQASSPAWEARARLGDRLLARTPEVLTTFVEALRRDPALPGAAGAARTQLEGHVGTLLAALAQHFAVLDDVAANRAPLIADGGALNDVLAERHGAQRARLGWTADAVRREFAHLGDAVEQVLRGPRAPTPRGLPAVAAAPAAPPPAALDDQLALFRTFLAETEAHAIAGLAREAARAPAPGA